MEPPKPLLLASENANLEHVSLTCNEVSLRLSMLCFQKYSYFLACSEIRTLENQESLDSITQCIAFVITLLIDPTTKYDETILPATLTRSLTLTQVDAPATLEANTLSILP